MTFKTRWIASSLLVVLFLVSVSYFMLDSLTFTQTTDFFPSDEKMMAYFRLAAILFTFPAITIALPPALLLPLKQRHKIAWFFSTAIAYTFIVPSSLFAFSTMGTLIFALFTNWFLGSPYPLIESPVLTAIMAVLLFLFVGGITGASLSRIQRGLLKKHQDMFSFLELAPIIKQWETQIIRGGAISGVLIPVVFALLTAIDFFFTQTGVGQGRLNIFSMIVLSLLALTLPLTLLTAAPAEELHAALNANNEELTVKNAP